MIGKIYSSKLQQMQKLQKNLLKDLNQLQTRQKEFQKKNLKPTLQMKTNTNIIYYKPTTKKVYTAKQMDNEPKYSIKKDLNIKKNEQLISKQNKQNKTNNINQKNMKLLQTYKIMYSNNKMNHNNFLPNHKSVISPSNDIQKNINQKFQRIHQITKKQQTIRDGKLISQNIQNLFNDQKFQIEDDDLELFNDNVMELKHENTFSKEDKKICEQKINISKILKDEKSKNNKTHSSHNSLQCTFKPSLLKKSLQIAQKMESSALRLNKSKKSIKENPYKQPNNTKRYSLERINNLSKPRLRKQVQQIKQQQQEQCTFKPKLSRKSLIQFNNCYLDVIGRNEIWQQQKQNKIKKLRQQQQLEKQKKQSQYRVNTLPTVEYKPDREVSLSRFNKEGLIGYFERVNHANELKKRQVQAQLKVSGRVTNNKNKGGVYEQKQIQSKNKTNKINGGYKQYQKAIKQLHQKILNLDL